MRKETFGLNSKELLVLKKLGSPKKVQDFLNKIHINFEPKGETCMSPRSVLRENRAHCIEGAMLAALAFRLHGRKPLLLDLKSAARDHDHVVAVFKEQSGWGAVSKTNHAVLRYREPIYKSIRELAMSYFHEYFLDDGKKTMRSYSTPLNLSRFDKRGWTTSEKNLWYISEALDDMPHFQILTKHALRGLRRADKIEIEAGKIVQEKKPKK